MTYGYIRIKNNAVNREETIQRYSEYLQSFGVEKLFVETDGSQLPDLLNVLKSGDVLRVVSIAHLSRNTEKVMEILKKFSENKIELYQSRKLVPLEPVYLPLIKAELSRNEEIMRCSISAIENMHTLK